jgi:hypothetical protein
MSNRYLIARRFFAGILILAGVLQLAGGAFGQISVAEIWVQRQFLFLTSASSDASEVEKKLAAETKRQVDFVGRAWADADVRSAKWAIVHGVLMLAAGVMIWRRPRS